MSRDPASHPATNFDRMPSGEFRINYHKLRRPTIVEVLGRPIGIWYPARFRFDVEAIDLDLVRELRQMATER